MLYDTSFFFIVNGYWEATLIYLFIQIPARYVWLKAATMLDVVSSFLSFFISFSIYFSHNKIKLNFCLIYFLLHFHILNGTMYFSSFSIECKRKTNKQKAFKEMLPLNHIRGRCHSSTTLSVVGVLPTLLHAFHNTNKLSHTLSSNMHGHYP